MNVIRHLYKILLFLNLTFIPFTLLANKNNPRHVALIYHSVYNNNNLHTLSTVANYSDLIRGCNFLLCIFDNLLINTEDVFHIILTYSLFDM